MQDDSTKEIDDQPGEEIRNFGEIENEPQRGIGRPRIWIQRINYTHYKEQCRKNNKTGDDWPISFHQVKGRKYRQGGTDCGGMGHRVLPK